MNEYPGIPLDEFARTGSWQQVLEYADSDGFNLLTALLKRRELTAAAALLDRGFPVDKNNWGYCTSALTEMAEVGAIDAMKLLLSRGADVNGHEHEDRPPLHAALCRHHQDAALLLIEHGAEVNRRDGCGKTSLDYALDERVIMKLVEAGAASRKQA